MPEVMSAEEFAANIPLDMCYGEVEGINEAKTVELIRYRDSAMLEKYKEAVARTLKDHCMYPGKIDVIISSLDSAFAEIEGGK